MEKLTFKLEQFEGPLDLLLHLISKHKLNLYDIQIDLLLEQYLAQMEQIPFADLEQASDFLEMASRLVYMKSAMLLPKYEDEGEDLKRELTGQLLVRRQVVLPSAHGTGTGHDLPAHPRAGGYSGRLSFGTWKGETKAAAAKRSFFRHCKTADRFGAVTDHGDPRSAVPL